MSQDNEREAMLREIAKKQVVYALPEMDAVIVHRDVTFQSRRGTHLPMDVYYPPFHGQALHPVVLMTTAYPDTSGRVRNYGPLTSWARLMAVSGMAAVVYGTEAPNEDVDALLRFLRGQAAALSLDIDRCGVFGASANVTVGLSILMRDRHLKCGGFLYGYTLDADGSTAVADAAREFGFVNGCMGRSVEDLPSDVPILFVRGGQDRFPGLNATLDRMIEGAMARNLPFSLINHASGAHGFDIDEPTAASRAVVQQLLAFMRIWLRA